MGLTPVERVRAWQQGPRREHFLAYQREYGRRHRVEKLEETNNRRALGRAIIDSELAKGCVDCGTKEQVVLDLDHVRGTKIMSVSRMILFSTNKLWAEIDKCEVRCANCHRRVTASRRTLMP